MPNREERNSRNATPQAAVSNGDKTPAAVIRDTLPQLYGAARKIVRQHWRTASITAAPELVRAVDERLEAELPPFLAEVARWATAFGTCTGVAAVWCPRCGDCACPTDERGGYAHGKTDPSCPLHAPSSKHAESPRG